MCSRLINFLFSYNLIAASESHAEDFKFFIRIKNEEIKESTAICYNYHVPSVPLHN